MDFDKIKGELDTKLDPANVTKASGGYGPKGDYIEGWRAISEANRIFGYGGWSYETELSKISDFVNANGNTEIGYICKLRLTVGDTVRQDVGYGSGASKNIGDAHEGAVKEAVTDALKRSLRTFGNQFGLALYDKKKENVGVDLPPMDAAQAFDDIKADLAAAQDMAALGASWTAYRPQLSFIEGTRPDLFAQVVNFKDLRKKELSNAT